MITVETHNAYRDYKQLSFLDFKDARAYYQKMVKSKDCTSTKLIENGKVTLCHFGRGQY